MSSGTETELAVATADVAVPTPPSVSPSKRPPTYRRYVKGVATPFRNHREAASSTIFFLLLLIVFIAAAPNIWLNERIYLASAATAPQYIFLAVALVFVIASGEIDLSFASVTTLASYVFALMVTHGIPVSLAIIAALAAGICAETLAGIIVAYGKMSSFVVTLGMYYMWDGLINVLSHGNSISISNIESSSVTRAYIGSISGVPAQLFWAIGFSAIALVLLSRRPFGIRALAVGDNSDSSREQGINVARIKVGAFALVGFAAGAVGIMLALVNSNFYPGAGDGLLLPGLAAVFIGGTAITGGAGTVFGAFMGSLSITIIATGIVTAGLSGSYTSFVEGIIIVLSVLVLRVTARWKRT